MGRLRRYEARFCLLHLLIGLAALPVWAQEAWVPLDLFGGIPQSLVIDPTNSQIVYAAYSSSVYKSLDGGATWSPANEGLGSNGARGLGIAPSSPATLYALRGPEDAYRTTDGATSWSARHLCPECGVGMFGEAMVDPTDPDQVYVCDYEFGVTVSDDGAATFPLTGPECDGGLHVSSAGTAFVASRFFSQRASRSTNLGVTWNPIGPAPDALARGVGSDPNDPQRIYLSATSTVVSGNFHISTDGGSTWTLTGSGLPGTGRLVVASTVPTTVYWFDGPDLYKSVDAGLSFAPLVSDLPPIGIWRLVQASGDASRLFVLPFSRELYRSADGGSSWQISQQGIRSGLVLAVFFDPADPTGVYALQSTGLSRSLDGGATWRRVMSGLEVTGLFEVTHHPLVPSTLFASTSQGLYRSSDGGLNWNPWSATGYRHLAFHPNDPNTIYGVAGSNVFRSVNGGVDWTLVDTLLGNGQIAALAIDPGNPALLYAGTDSGLWRTTNAAAFWEFTGITGRIQQVTFDSTHSGRIYLLRDGLVERSDDGGNIFVPKPIGQVVSFLVISPGASATLYALGNGLWTSASAGDAWSRMTDDGLVRPGGRGLAVDPLNPARLLLATAGNGLYQLEREVVFADGFESGTTAAWTATVP